MPKASKSPTKKDAIPTTLLTFSFQSTPPALYRVTRVAWTPEAYRIVAGLSEALYKYKEKKKLPIRDLRLRTQVYDPGTVRVASTLGIGFLDAPKEEHDILFTSSSPADAAEYANDAVADWVNEAVNHVEGLKSIDKQQAQELRKLALNDKKGVVTARVENVAVFQWSTNPATGSAQFPADPARPDRPLKTGFADLADYVASLVVGQILFPGAGAMRREITADLKRGTARLLTDPLAVAVGAKTQCWISSGLTIKVITYPGRPLPVIRVSMEKRIWTTAPKGRFVGNDLGGYALPNGELRAFKFSLKTDTLEPKEEYRAIARRYTDLPVRADLTGLELAQNGLSYPTRVLVTAAPGRSGVKVADRGVTDLDKQLAFEALTSLLGEHGFTPWGSQLELVETGTKTLTKLTGQWEVMLDKKKNKDTLKTQAFKQWARALHAGLKQHYGGTHRILLAYQTGLEEDAKRVALILKAVLGEKGVSITQQMLPKDVHGPKRLVPGEKVPKPLERAGIRLASWKPWLAEVETIYAEKKQALPHGVLVLARKKYGPDRDDPISKQVGRVSLITGLKGAMVQYLLPSTADPQVAPTPQELKEFQMRVMNGWRDLALKSVGRMHDLPDLLAAMPYVQRTGKRPVILGAGIVRINKTNAKKNRTSFIPYMVELDPDTGECQAAIMLRKSGSNSAARIFNMQALKKAVLQIAEHGPSYLAVVDKRKNQQIMTERQQLTEKFLYETLLDRTSHYQAKDREVILLADSYTLSGVWQWLADARINPADVAFPMLGRSKMQDAMPNLTIVRLRREHAAKVLLPTPQIKVTFEPTAGPATEPRPSARWADAKLYRLADSSPHMPTYLSFGSSISTQMPRGVSSYRRTVRYKQTKAEDNSTFLETKDNAPYTKTWATPNAVEITVLPVPGRPAQFEAGELAFMVEKLRSAYDHFGGWTTMPGPLHFASVLKEYIPDYDLAEAEALEKDDK